MKLKIDEGKLLEDVRELYDAGLSQRQIADRLGVSKTVAASRIDKLLARGDIKPRDNIFRKRDIVPKVYELYNQGLPTLTIANRLGICSTTAHRYIKNGIESGVLGRVQPTRKKKGESTTPLHYEKKWVPSTLAPGETIRCSRAVSGTCVYGIKEDVPTMHLCRYIAVTGKSRMRICSHKACTCYSKVSKSNPRLSSMGEEI